MGNERSRNAFFHLVIPKGKRLQKAITHVIILKYYRPIFYELLFNCSYYLFLGKKEYYYAK